MTRGEESSRSVCLGFAFRIVGESRLYLKKFLNIWKGYS